MEDYLEPSIEEYARFHGLTRDHLQPHPLLHINQSSDIWQRMQDSSDLFQITPENATLPVERLAIGPEAATFLTSIGPQTHRGLPSPLSDSIEIETHGRRHLKQELPLLRRDHDHDLWLFARRIEPELTNEFLPCEALDEEADEALTWPSQTQLLPDTQWTKACSEKFAASVDDLLYLQKALKWHTDGGEHKTFQEDEGILQYQKDKALKPLSPPLLPASPEMIPHEPSSDTCHLDLISESTDSIKGEHNTIEENIFKDEAGSYGLGDGKLSPVLSQTSFQPRKSPDDTSSPLKYIQDPGSSSPVIRKSMAQCKVEVPLSPPCSAQAPWVKKHASFTDAMSEAMGSQPVLIPASSSGGEEDIDTFFGSTIAPIATNAERGIEQEQLMEADTILRVRIPVMDLSKPKLPWDSHYDSSLEVLKMLQIHEIIEPKKHSWKPNGKAERELSWVPFPATLAAVDIGEIRDDGTTSTFLDHSEHLNSEDLVWKQEGLRILDWQDSDEEDLEEGTFPDGNDLFSLVRKRRSVIDEDSELKPHSNPPKRVQQADGSKSTALNEKRPPGTISQASRLLRSDSGAQVQANSIVPEQTQFAALGALDNFMAMRNGTGGPLANGSFNFFGTSPQAALQDPSSVIGVPSSEPAAFRESRNDMEKNVALPSPKIQVPADKRQFMMSTAFLSHRSLVHRMLELYPTADIIERDFNVQNLAEKPPEDTLFHEADIIISPSTGILLTSLQKIKQRPLPGQASRSEVRDRISITAPRYEQLIILVRYDQAHEDDMTQNDCEALAEFVGFCSSISSTDILVKMIAGGEDHLAKWIIALMVEHSHPDRHELIVLEETPWELFLRQAGLNAFAAHMILNDIRASSTDERISMQDALSAFVSMSLEEKLARFENPLGGRRALTTTHHILDARW